MLSGRSLKDIVVREDRVDCKPYNKFMLSTVNPEISEEKVGNKWNKFTVDSLLRTPLLNGLLELHLVPVFLFSIYVTLYRTDITLRPTLNACPKGVRLRES